MDGLSGWKTKYGAIAYFLGMVLNYAAETIPVPEIIPWLKFAGGVLVYGGGAFTGVGLVHKAEKAGILSNPKFKVYKKATGELMGRDEVKLVRTK